MRAFWTLLRRAGWAPITVLLVHQAIAYTPIRQAFDFPMHFSGGAAAAYFLFHALGCFDSAVGDLRPAPRYLFSFSLACTVGMFWEFAELLSDVFLGTRIQKTVHETMRDLSADAAGAFTALLLLALWRTWRSRPAQ